MTDPGSVNAAFAAAWPKDVLELPLTVFHCAALLRFQDRCIDFIGRCWRVNVDGTRHVLHAAKASGANCFVATSSGSVAMKRQGFFAAPWRRMPANFMQSLPNTDPDALDTLPENFNTCYAATKARMEHLVHEANDDKFKFRAACIRPAHAIYGQGVKNSNSITWGSLTSQGGPTWLATCRLQFVHALNVSLAHLNLEHRLLNTPGTVCGKSYAVTEHDLISYADYYLALTTLAETPMQYRLVPPLLIVVAAYLVEAYVLIRARVAPFLPATSGNLDLLQPGMLYMSTGHFFYPIWRAQDDIAYEPAMRTLEGLCITVRDWNENAALSQQG